MASRCATSFTGETRETTGQYAAVSRGRREQGATCSTGTRTSMTGHSDGRKPDGYGRVLAGISPLVVGSEIGARGFYSDAHGIWTEFDAHPNAKLCSLIQASGLLLDISFQIQDRLPGESVTARA